MKFPKDFQELVLISVWLSSSRWSSGDSGTLPGVVSIGWELMDSSGQYPNTFCCKVLLSPLLSLSGTGVAQFCALPAARKSVLERPCNKPVGNRPASVVRRRLIPLK